MAVVTYRKILWRATKKKQLDIRHCCSICGKKLKFTSSITTSQFPLSCWQCMIINMDTWKYAYAWSRLLPSLVVDAIMIVIWYQARHRSQCYWYLITNYRQLTQVAKAYQASYLECHNDYHKQSYRWLRELYKCSNCKKELRDGWTTCPYCGHIGRDISVVINETIGIKENVVTVTETLKRGCASLLPNA